MCLVYSYPENKNDHGRAFPPQAQIRAVFEERCVLGREVFSLRSWRNLPRSWFTILLWEVQGYRDLAGLGGASFMGPFPRNWEVTGVRLSGVGKEARDGGRWQFVKVLRFYFILRIQKTACHSWQDFSNTLLTLPEVPREASAKGPASASWRYKLQH